MKAQKFTKETILNIGTRDRKFADFKVGDSIRIGQRIIEEAKEGSKEATKERIQYFEGDVIAKRGRGNIATTFTVRKIGANSIPVERIFAWYSPLITEVTLLRRGKVRRAKLFYMRSRVGTRAYTEKILKSAQKVPTSASTSDNATPEVLPNV